MKSQERTWALVNGTTIENIIVAEPEFIANIADSYDAVPEATNTVAYIGGQYVNGAFVPKPQADMLQVE